MDKRTVTGNLHKSEQHFNQLEKETATKLALETMGHIPRDANGPSYVRYQGVF